tara:strand:+ start:2565 stop:3416 length:852 start_codon:yes stop_codon:yes gene_type:complete
MKTVNSLSGGKTSSYIAANYKADYNVFSLVRTDDNNCMFPDVKIRQEVSDRLGTEFIGTLEDDTIIYTMLDLEQYIGSKIEWVTGKTFDDIILRKNGTTFLPSYMRRFCTTELKVEPIKKFWFDKIKEPIEMRIGFRANEHNRAKSMINKLNTNGFESDKFIIGNSKNGRNKWSEMDWRKPSFPLIEDNIFKDTVENYWKDKDVRFAWMNNCVGCMHKEFILLNKMSKIHPNKLEWFASKERVSKNGATWKENITYDKIIAHNMQTELFEDDFNDCDSGYCGV